MIIPEKVEILSLNKEWVLINKKKSIEIPVEVPGSVFEALYDNKIIKDPFYGLRERDVNSLFDLLENS